MDYRILLLYLMLENRRRKNNFTNLSKIDESLNSSQKPNLLPSKSPFFCKRRSRRSSDFSAINDMIKLSTRDLNKKPQKISFNHFKKNNNKVQCNLEAHQGSLSKQNKPNTANPKHFIHLAPHPHKKIQRQSYRNRKCSQMKQSLPDKTNFSRTCSNFKQLAQNNRNSCHLQQPPKNPKFMHRKTKTQNLNNVVPGFEKENKIFPRFKKYQLLGLYKSLLEFSDNDPNKFLKGFESALSHHRMILKPQIIEKKLWQKKQLTFSQFLNLYKSLENIVFIQNIIDFLEIIFEPYRNQQMSYKMMTDILMKRTSEKISQQIAKNFFKRLSKSLNHTITYSEIIQLCQNDLDFGLSLSPLYSCPNMIKKTSF